MSIDSTPNNNYLLSLTPFRTLSQSTDLTYKGLDLRITTTHGGASLWSHTLRLLCYTAQGLDQEYIGNYIQTALPTDTVESAHIAWVKVISMWLDNKNPKLLVDIKSVLNECHRPKP